MPKRKRHSDDFDKIRRKIRKLERDLCRVREQRDGDSREYEDYYYSDRSDINSIRDESENSLDPDMHGDLSEYPPTDITENRAKDVPTPTPAPATASAPAPAITPAPASSTEPSAVHKDSHNAPPATASNAVPTTAPRDESSTTDIPNQANDATAEAAVETPVILDCSILEILGADPAAAVEYGKDIHKELASRLEHIAMTGLSKEARKELADKYLVPANCTKIAAPLMNAEIKAAVTEIVTKRDKGIEMRQKQLAGAISGLAGIMTKELESKDIDSERLKQLMDVGRILCDVQHNESVTRRNFVIFSIKKDLKDHIANAKIDKYLFGESLADALKTAKAVSKSGTDLKVKNQVRGPKPSTSSNYASSNYTTSNLNWRGPAPARRQQGPQRGREPAHPAPPGPPARYTRAPPHGNSSKTSQPPQRHYRRR